MDDDIVLVFGLTGPGPGLSRNAQAAAVAAMLLTWPLHWQPLTAQQRSRATTESPLVLVPIATCCERTEELWQRYQNTAPADRPAELAFLGAEGFTGALRAVVKDTVMWARLWSGMHHGIMQPRNPSEPPTSDSRDWTTYEPPLPRVDFDREMLIVVGAGKRPTTGYSLRIDSVRVGRSRDGARELRVHVTEWRPGRLCGTGQAVTSPVALARLRRLDLAVRFIERTRYASCVWPRRPTND